jgi:Zn-dependent membrane protease YugP
LFSLEDCRSTLRVDYDPKDRFIKLKPKSFHKMYLHTSKFYMRHCRSTLRVDYDPKDRFIKLKPKSFHKMYLHTSKFYMRHCRSTLRVDLHKFIIFRFYIRPFPVFSFFTQSGGNRIIQNITDSIIQFFPVSY